MYVRLGSKNARCSKEESREEEDRQQVLAAGEKVSKINVTEGIYTPLTPSLTAPGRKALVARRGSAAVWWRERGAYWRGRGA